MAVLASCYILLDLEPTALAKFEPLAAYYEEHKAFVESTLGHLGSYFNRAPVA